MLAKLSGIGLRSAPPLVGNLASNTITVRLPEDLAVWLEAAARKAGLPRGRIIREQLGLARRRHDQPFLHLAGSVEGGRDLSARKGFTKR